MSVAVIQALYDPKVLLAMESNEYQHILDHDDVDSIAPQLYYLLKHQGQLDKTPAFFQAFLKEKYRTSALINMFIRSELNQILQLFEDTAIDAIPIKGITFAEKYFGHFAARPTSDIDLLIKKSDLKRAVEQLKRFNFTIEEVFIADHFHCSFSKALPNSTIPLTVELHWDLVRGATSHFEVKEFWYQSKPLYGYQYIKQLTNYHTFYLMVLHGWRHNLDSLKHYLDIIQMIDLLREDLDYERLMWDAQSHLMKKRMIRTLSMVYAKFPFLDQIKPFPYKTSKAYWEYNEDERLKKYINFIDYQFLSYDSFKHTLIELKKWIIPSEREMRNELGFDVNGTGLNTYYSLYKKRFLNLSK